jgi:hypothetical protein
MQRVGVGEADVPGGISPMSLVLWGVVAAEALVHVTVEDGGLGRV